ncbi:MAG: hypothetical protein WCW44_05705 [archaeon]|jgi:hypothetical protein
MGSNKLNAPVLFLVFNRPDTALRVFGEIRKAKPKRLYVACDGPRVNRADDVLNVGKVRGIVENVDWDCDVKYLFRKENLGCGRAVSEAITWFFEHEEMGIILEDDCLPDQSFFPYCEELLKKYKGNEKIMMISGDNYQYNGGIKVKESYFFSKYSHIWGWATWRRAWNKFDLNVKKWPLIKGNKLPKDFFDSKQEEKYFSKAFDLIYLNPTFTWDIQWLFTCWYNKGLSVYPNKNLVKNIGFEGQYTNTLIKKKFILETPLESMGEIVHPKSIFRNIEADKFTFNRWFKKSSSKIIFELLPLSVQRLVRKIYSRFLR